MLNNIRKLADGFVARILLGMVAFAFVGWGVKDALQSRNNYDLVTFKDAKNITEDDFLKAKAEEISVIQKQNSTSLTEEDIKKLNIDKIVLERLIKDNILDYIVNYYNLNLTDEAVIELIKKSPMFQNEEGRFDIDIFKSVFRNSYQREEDYLRQIKERTLKSALISVFFESFKVPELMINNIVNYMAETRNLDLVSIELNTNSMNVNIPAPTNDQLKELYQKHPDLFTKAEMRSVNYIEILPSFVQRNIKELSDQELLAFYDEHKDEYHNKAFNDVKKEVNKIVQQQKFDELMIEFEKNLEDDVASGSSLKEISEKYEIKLQTAENLSYETMAKDKTSLADAIESIFEMTEGEISYPIEMTDKKGLLLVELVSVKPSYVEYFQDVIAVVEKSWRKNHLESLNLKRIENIASSYKSKTEDKQALSGISVNSKFSIARSDLEENQSLPTELLMSIFQIKAGSSTPVFRQGNKAYFAFVKQIIEDKTKAKTIKESSRENISTTIKNGVMNELISYFVKKNNTKINYKDRSLQQ